jgi:two-component system, LuxR family, response regulator DctR
VSEAAKLRIFVVDDDDAVRQSLALLLGRRYPHIVRPHGSGESFLEALQPESAGCVVLDVRMPGMAGPEAFARLRETHGQLITIFLSGHGDIPMAVQAIKEGAFDFLEKPCDDQTLLDKVAHALTVAEGVMRQRKVEASVQERMSTLTPREVEVAQKLREGRNNKEIAREIDVNFRTVEHYRANVFAKMGVRNAVELAQLLFDRDGRR